MQIDLKDFNFLLTSIDFIKTIYEDIVNYQHQRLSEIESLFEEVEQELNISQNFLNIAKAFEAQKLAILMQEEAELANALSQEAAAIASGNPAAIAAASAYVAKKTYDVSIAADEYNKAKENRFNMEKRVEIVTKAMRNITSVLESSKIFFNSQIIFLNTLTQETILKLNKAYDAIMGYYNHKSYVESIDIVKPDNLKHMLELDKKKAKEYFDLFYSTYVKFKIQVDKLKQEYKNAKNEFEKEKIIQKIRKNLVGAYAEKYVQTSFSSLGKVQTQHTQALDDSFSKVDLLITDIKKPIILGKGKCKYLKKGDSLAIEIKTGSKEYIKSQKEHLIFQTKAHKKTADVSVIITSKDIYDLRNEEEFRSVFKDECSHILAMLPKKSEIDKYILESMELK